MGDQATWWLADGEAQHAATPWSFLLPPRRRRRRLHAGQFAKLIFEFAPRPYDGWEPEGERMWVRVTDKRGQRYVGTLASAPEVLTELSFGDVIEFGPENVIAISSRSLG